MNSYKINFLAVLALLAAGGTTAAQTGNVRGFPAGQSVYYNGYYGAAPSYAYAAPPAAYYAPAYQQGYPAPAYPARQAYYPSGVAVAPSAQAGRIAYYTPPSPGYAISPAGGSSSGAEAFAYYGQQQRLNYVPPTYYYQTRMVPVPVTYYRPVTVYQPGTGVATTCQRACTGTQCQPQRSRLFNWFGSNTCNYGNCSAGSCAPATACGAVPYYNTVPGVAAPATVFPAVPSTTAPRGFNNILTPRTTVPPPGTGVIGVPADNQPFISPSTTIPASPPAIRSTVPGSTPPPSSFGTPGGFGTGASGSAPATGSAPVFGSNFRSSFDKAKPQSDIQLSRPTITEPGLKPRASEVPSTLRPVPDPDAGQRTKPGNRAPALINPNDKTARTRAIQPLGAATWGVVPARWPEQPQEVNYKVETASAEMASGERQFPDANRMTPASPVAEEKWDDSGWKSAR